MIGKSSPFPNFTRTHNYKDKIAEVGAIFQASAVFALVFRCSGTSASLGLSLSTASPIYDGNLREAQYKVSNGYPKSCRRQRDLPRYTIPGEFLKAIRDDCTDFGGVLSLLIAQACTNIKGLRENSR